MNIFILHLFKLKWGSKSMYINHICSYVEQIYVHKSYMYVEINAINKKIFFLTKFTCEL